MQDTVFKPLQEVPIHDGTQKIYKFNNGYGASVVRHRRSYGGKEGLWELAVLKGQGITYDTPITNDVIGWLSEQEVENTLQKIESLPTA